MRTMVLKNLRKQANKTLTQVAAIVGTDAGNLSRIERRLQQPEPSLAMRLAEYYEITLDQVYEFNNND